MSEGIKHIMQEFGRGSPMQVAAGPDKIEKRFQEWLKVKRPLWLDPKNIHGPQYNAALEAFRAGYEARNRVESGKRRAR